MHSVNVSGGSLCLKAETVTIRLPAEVKGSSKHSLPVPTAASPGWQQAIACEEQSLADPTDWRSGGAGR